MLEHEVHPFFQERGDAEPEQGMVEHDDVVFYHQLLFTCHMYVKIRVLLIKIVEGDSFNVPDVADQLFIDPRLLKRGVANSMKMLFLYVFIMIEMLIIYHDYYIRGNHVCVGTTLWYGDELVNFMSVQNK